MLKNILPGVTGESMRMCVIGRTTRRYELHEKLLQAIIEAANDGHTRIAASVPNGFVDNITQDLLSRKFNISTTEELNTDDVTVLNIVW